ncbi:UNVERIFIED_CONTAM: hypothetical protein Sindi_2801700 [Sesamum indicum]
MSHGQKNVYLNLDTAISPLAWTKCQGDNYYDQHTSRTYRKIRHDSHTCKEPIFRRKNEDRIYKISYPNGGSASEVATSEKFLILTVKYTITNVNDVRFGCTKKSKTSTMALVLVSFFDHSTEQHNRRAILLLLVSTEGLRLEHVIVSMTFHFRVPGERVFLLNKDNTSFCLGLMPTVLGAMQQHNMRFTYAVNKGTVSFSPDDCVASEKASVLDVVLIISSVQFSIYINMNRR